MRRAKRFFHDAATMAGRRLRRGGIWSLRLRFLVALLRLLPLPLPLLLLLLLSRPRLGAQLRFVYVCLAILLRGVHRPALSSSS